MPFQRQAGRGQRGFRKVADGQPLRDHAAVAAGDDQVAGGGLALQSQVVHTGGAIGSQTHVTGQDAGIQRGAVQNADVDRGVHESQDAAVLLADPAHDAHQAILGDDRHPGADALRLADVDDKGAGGIIRHPRDDGGRLQRVIGVAVADAEELAVQVILVFQLVVIRLAAGQLIDQRLQLLVG